MAKQLNWFKFHGIPEEVVVKGTKYTIKFADVCQVNGAEAEGYCDIEQKVIAIKNYPKNSLFVGKTFLHEVFHALWFELGLYSTDIDQNLQEILAENYSNFLGDLDCVKFGKPKKPPKPPVPEEKKKRRVTGKRK